MSTNPPDNLEQAIRQSGESWLIDRFDPPSEAMNQIRRTLDEVDRLAKRRFGGNAPHLSESSLLEEYQRNPLRVKGFFQALGASRTPDMLLMAWRIIQGMEIKRIELLYARKEPFNVRVTLESPHGEEDAPYASIDANDFKILRHIGIFEIDANTILYGFYPLNLRN